MVKVLMTIIVNSLNCGLHTIVWEFDCKRLD